LVEFPYLQQSNVSFWTTCQFGLFIVHICQVNLLSTSSANKAFIDIRLRAPVSQRREVRYTSRTRSCGPLRPNVTSSIKPEVQNVAQRRRRRTEPRPRGIRIQNFVKIGPVVPEICSRTDRRTDRRVDRNTPHPYRGGVTKRTRCFGTCMKQLTLNRYQSS